MATILMCVLFGTLLGWPIWMWAVVVVVPILTATVLSWPSSRVRAVPVAPRPMPPPSQQVEPKSLPPGRREVTDVLLPSARTGYSFAFSCVVRWMVPDGRSDREIHPNPGALAMEAVLGDAERLCAELQPAQAGPGAYRLEAALGDPRHDRTGRLTVWVESVSLQLSERDRARVEALEEVHKEEEVFDRQCTFERKVRDYLGSDVLSSAGSAVVWHLTRTATPEKDNVKPTVEMLDKLRQLVDSANGVDNAAAAGAERGVPLGNGQGVLPLIPEMSPAEPAATSAPTVDEHAMAIVEHIPDPDERVLFGDHLTQLLRSHGGEDAAENLESRIGSAEPGDASDADTPAEPTPESWSGGDEDSDRD
ncbi:hypothetical protein [Saccharomonospora sp. CUA-673]|uniref:hypothetical protein n=1 Tax=Saccharomonospora sp. CUA-673 TaxID=1904969 RepID=UPI00111527FB|nr:hypothetical protein [Saccharomonospora sp. CUA-673]